MRKVPITRKGKGKNEKTAASSLRRLDPASTVDSIVNKALKTSASKMGLRDAKAVIACLKENDPVACSYCHYNVAKELGAVLGSWDKNIRAVYAYGYDDNTSAQECSENISLFSLVHMIIWAERKTKALKALIEAIDHALAQHQRQLFALKELEHVLDVQVIDDVDVKSRTGYASLLKSIHQMPVQVWGDSN
ncbi:MAG: hypothetical protein JW901_07825 [Dehalococcoidia bacterium]|nr:hypothetical protein [Dehalococcoidia bacterium]